MYRRLPKSDKDSLKEEVLFYYQFILTQIDQRWEDLKALEELRAKDKIIEQ